MARASATRPNSRAFVGSGLHVRLVDLDDVGTGCEEVADLLVHRRRVVDGEGLLALVEIVLGLLRHRERPGHGHLHGPVGVGLQELQVADLDRMLAADRPDHARHRVRVAAAVEGRAGIVDVDPLERRREPVRVALAPHLTVGHDVEPRELLVADGEDRRVVLCLLQPLRRDSPELRRADAGREPAGEPLSVDQPVRLRV